MCTRKNRNKILQSYVIIYSLYHFGVGSLETPFKWNLFSNHIILTEFFAIQIPFKTFKKMHSIK